MTNLERYEKALHAMQSGVAMEINYDNNSIMPKHLRVGINSALVETSMLAKILISKGIITSEEYEKELADSMEIEKRRYETMLSNHFGREIKLG